MQVLRKIILICVCSLVLPLTISFSEATQKRVLILNSYNDRYAWTVEVMNGVTETMRENFDSLDVRIEYMDTKNINTDEYYEALYKLLEYKYGSVDFDAVISVDDNALRFITEYRDALFEDVPIFFCGINFLNAHDILKEKGVYGIVETPSAMETIKVAIKQNPNLKKIYVVLDESFSGQSSQKHIELEFGQLEGIEIDFMDDKAFNEIVDVIKNIDEDAIVIYGFYVVDIDGTTFSLAPSTSAISDVSPVPVYGLWSFSLGHGIVGGKLISGYEQGAVVVELMKDYLDGRRFESGHYIEYSESNKHVYDYVYLHKYGLNLNALPKNSVVLNKPDSFYEKHQIVIHWGLGIIFLLVIYIGLLSVQVKRKTIDLKSSLVKIKETQEKLIESEKMASLGHLVAGVAHEVNTPLGNAITMATFMNKETDELIDKFEQGQLKKNEMKEYTLNVSNSGNELVKNLNEAANMIDAFKGVAVGNSTELISEFNLKDCLGNLVLTYRSKLRDSSHDILLNCPDDILLMGKSGLYFQLIGNLLNNSLEHGFNKILNGVIEIDVVINEKDLILHYSDNGVGVNKDELDQLFDPFYTSKRGEGHIGLGMFTVYNLVQTLRGEIKLLDKKNPGFHVMIQIPLNETEDE